MNVSNDSTLYLILTKTPNWKNWLCEIRSTDNGAHDWITSMSGWRGPDVKIAVCALPGLEIINRSIILTRQSLRQNPNVFPIKNIQQMLAEGVPHTIEVKHG